MNQSEPVLDTRLMDLHIIDAIAQYVDDSTPNPILSREDLSVGAMAGFTPQQAAAILIDAQTRQQLLEMWETYQASHNRAALPAAIERIMGEESASTGTQWHVILANETGFGSQWLEPGWHSVLETLPESLRRVLSADVSRGSVPTRGYDLHTDLDLVRGRGDDNSSLSGWNNADWDMCRKVPGFRIGLRIDAGSVVVGLWCASQKHSGFYDLTLIWANGRTQVIKRIEGTPGVTRKHGGIPCPEGELPVELSIAVSRG